MSQWIVSQFEYVIDISSFPKYMEYANFLNFMHSPKKTQWSMALILDDNSEIGAHG